MVMTLILAGNDNDNYGDCYMMKNDTYVRGNDDNDNSDGDSGW